ncbi:single-stranded-DNA-specific exonuclease RecJ [Candidatus Kaiserbacteria bacterium]|nr:single-stranded-DNA-specific exonuclease RecJ [Candidatus Kaiserbacteria bacterium]
MPLSDLVQSLLAKRGVVDPDAVAAFLQPDYASLHSPFLLEGIEAAVTRTLDAIAAGERIAVYADFDCDGIPGASLLSDVFAKIRYENVEVYIPHRDREGYGVHESAITALAKRGVKLIITVDVGTTAVAAVRYAKEQDVDVIVTDHHEIMSELPDAVAVLNPKLGSYPFRDLCGTGVAFKFAQALLTRGRERGMQEFLSVSEGWEKWLLDLVAIATVADMVPLLGENRTLVHWGLSVLRKTPRVGITALCNEMRIRKSEITEDEIGFSIAPRINAASRMDEPQLALSLLTTRDKNEAETLARQLEKLNASRKGVVAGIVKQAKKHMNERFRDDERVVVLGDPEWKPALLGLAANSLLGTRSGLVCLWGRDANGKLKGSCRSDGSLSIVDVFTGASDCFEEFGGHAASGGFTLVSERVHTLQESLSAAAAASERAPEKENVAHDALITLREVSGNLLKDISRLAPFGVGNKKPVFLIRNAVAVSAKAFGKEKNHVEVHLTCSESGMRARGFDFFRTVSDFTMVPEAGRATSVLATIERDTFRGGLALRLVDVLPGS